MARILITDGEQRAALAAVRSLGAAGHVVTVCSSRPRSIAGASRFAADSAQVPDALQDGAGFVEAVRALVRGRDIDTILPITEPALLALLPVADDLGGARIPFPAHEQFLRICDKEEVALVAATLGIRVPAQLRIEQPIDGRRAVDAGRFPLVLKPTRSVVGDAGERKKVSVIHVSNASELAAALERLPAAAYPVLAQERIVGPGVGVFLLLRDGEASAAFAHRRLREKPPSGGVSVLRESIPLDPDLLERSVRLLRAFDWEGVAMVEYKVSQATGEPYIMEINGRFWGSLQLAIDAGVDFPRLLVEGNQNGPVTSYRSGVKLRWELGDLDHLVARLRRSARELALPPESPGRIGAIGAFLTGFAPGIRQEVFRWGDPRPMLVEGRDWLRGR